MGKTAWTEKDMQRVRAILERICAELKGGQSELARECGQKSRAAVHNWLKRGRVPLECHDKVIALSPEPITPQMLHPSAKAVVKTQQMQTGQGTVAP